MRHAVRDSCADAMSWMLIGGLAASCMLLGHAMGFGVPLGRAVLPGIGLAVLIAARAIGRRRGNVRLEAGASAFLQMTLFTILGVVFTYLLAARAGPLWDAELAAADARLGLVWPTIFAAADHLPASILLIGGIAYHSLVLQMVACIVLLASADRLDRLRTMVAAAILSGTVTVIVSGIVPAVGNLFDPHHYRTLWPSVAWLDRDLVLRLRGGTMRQVDLSHMTGIVSFPSYHATLPVILLWGLRPFPRLRLAAMVWAGLTIAATPLFGGHYGVDVLAGLLLAVGGVAVAKRLSSGSPNGMLRPDIRGTHASRTAEPRRFGGKDGIGVIHDLV